MHRSAIMDYKFVFFDRTMQFLYVPLFSGITYKIYSTTIARLGPGPVHLPSGTPFWLIAIFALLVTDLSLYISHYAMHRVRFLWPFHEVHHSAEVLTPATSHRIHPVGTGDDVHPEPLRWWAPPSSHRPPTSKWVPHRRSSA